MSDLVKVRCRCKYCESKTTRKNMMCRVCDSVEAPCTDLRKVTRTQRQRMGKRTWEVAAY